MALVLKNIKESDIDLASGNMGGLVQEMYVAKRDDIASFTAGSTDLEVSGIVMKPGKKFVRWYFTPQTGKLTQKIVGEEDGKSFESELVFSMPKFSVTTQEQLAFVANSSLVVVSKDANGNYHIIGTTEIPCKIKDGGPDTGAKYADKNHAAFTFMCASRIGTFFYTGSMDGLIEGDSLENVALFAGTASAATDTLTLTWNDNSASFTNAEATDTLSVVVTNTTTGDVFTRGTAVARSVETASIVLFNISASDVIRVDYWVKNPDGLVSNRKTISITAGA